MERIINEENLKLGGWEESDKYSTQELIEQGYDGLKLEDEGETTYQIFYPEKLGIPETPAAEPTVQAPEPTFTAKESNAEFISNYDTKDQIADFLTELGSHYDTEIQRFRDQGNTIKEANAVLASQWDNSVLANARRMIGTKGGLSDAAYKSIRGKLHKNVERYRLLLADLRHDTDALREIQMQMEEGEVTPEMSALLADAQARAEQAITEEAAGAAALESQTIQPERRTTKQQIRRSVEGMT
ncbi:MAG: hypothetical protein ABIG63_16205, partial [Chloroflexota bacterium]